MSFLALLKYERNIITGDFLTLRESKYGPRALWFIERTIHNESLPVICLLSVFIKLHLEVTFEQISIAEILELVQERHLSNVVANFSTLAASGVLLRLAFCGKYSYRLTIHKCDLVGNICSEWLWLNWLHHHLVFTNKHKAYRSRTK